MYPGTFSKMSGDTLIASAATITPKSEVVRVSGTAAIVNIVVPPLQTCTVLYVIPTGIFTWTTAGNISLAGTAVVGKLIVFVYSKVLNKWNPSVVA